MIYSLGAITSALCAGLLVSRVSRYVLSAALVEFDLPCRTHTEQCSSLAGQGGIPRDRPHDSEDSRRSIGDAGSLVRADLGGRLMEHVADVLAGAAAMASLAGPYFF